MVRCTKGRQTATFVIVHGALGGSEWQAAALLRAWAQGVHAVAHWPRRARPSGRTGDGPGDLHQVTLACQSYGGMVTTGVVGRMPERLAHLDYLNALVPEDGRSAFDLLPPALRQRLEEAARAGGAGWCVPAPPLKDAPRAAAFAEAPRRLPVAHVHRTAPDRAAARPPAAQLHPVYRGPGGAVGGRGHHAAVRRACAAGSGLAVPRCILSPMRQRAGKSRPPQPPTTP